jgi:hypothetical protein
MTIHEMNIIFFSENLDLIEHKLYEGPVVFFNVKLH